MVAVVTGATAAEAWRNGAATVAGAVGNEVPHLVTMIQDASVIDPAWLRTFDTRTVLPAAKSSRSVVEVLAPRVILDATRPRVDRYDAAWATFDTLRAKGISLSRWRDAYFERLTRLPGCNPLERIIDAINNWAAPPHNGLYITISNPVRDPPRTMGAPCLQYVQFHPQDGKISLTALYRNHDFLHKAFGNFLGLARIAQFVAGETGRTAGAVTCISVHAYTNNKGALKKLAQV